ncbi:MAG: (2Fe-2S)-binding protein [Oscillospiraceae bacterium]|jgi:predicted molibdopterin-dependent oxidoreductase YjgC|nr:(2Fe-2S)-binding protein [Oscillospiraceae bacterium]MCI1991092.1 (2Fe-2S)-binding protein [Oscillospiraceae bacterium]MCI2036316.1 (2Fe-2S)-binding protein [Oscillospiraceae bacterium]
MRIQQHPILNFEPAEEIPFYFEGKKLTGKLGDTIASALHANNIRMLRHEHRPRGLFCAIGNCASCLMEVDGRPNVRVCVEKLRPGMVVKIQKGNGTLGKEEK